MAKLRSEDGEFVTSFEIHKGSSRLINGQTWQRFKLTLTSGTYRLLLGEGEPAEESARHSAEEERDACLLCREPKDEVAQLAEHLNQIINFDREKLLFEPFEPTFELTISRSGVTGVKVEIWLDAGNAKTGIYRWDGVGVRFYTLQEHLVSFLGELKEEFAC